MKLDCMHLINFFFGCSINSSRFPLIEDLSSAQTLTKLLKFNSSFTTFKVNVVKINNLKTCLPHVLPIRVTKANSYSQQRKSSVMTRINIYKYMSRVSIINRFIQSYRKKMDLNFALTGVVLLHLQLIHTVDQLWFFINGKLFVL